MNDIECDVLVVGAGNAAACAALAAREHGASVIMLEAAPEDDSGGNSRYTAGAMRVVFNGVDDLAQLYDLTDDERRNVDFGVYTADQYLDDLMRITQYRSDPELAGVISDIAFVSAGQSGGAFDVFTVGSPTARDVTLTASYDGVSVSRVLSIGAAPAVSLSSLSVNAPSLRGGEGGIATVSLASPSTATILLRISTSHPSW